MDLPASLPKHRQKKHCLLVFYMASIKSFTNTNTSISIDAIFQDSDIDFMSCKNKCVMPTDAFYDILNIANVSNEDRVIIINDKCSEKSQ